ncbi:PDT-domain-containing protein [Hortaea werneckii]|nr:PDT-domain-containing protein [Hortaea werneckii]KAI7299313.1 PDT-domain-containing protein [Hortaea werneckii]
MEAKKEVVGFLGPKASYTHQATLGHFPGPQYDVRPLTTIEDVFAAVQSGQAAYGVVPFENSSNGSVVFTLDLFADLHGRYPDILVWDEIYLAVHHCLLGHIPHTEPVAKTAKLQENSTGTEEEEDGGKPDATLPHLPPQQQPPSLSGQVTPTQAVPQPAKARTQPLHPLTHIKKLYSHPQAWGQCKNFLAAYLKGTERQDVSSTSKAAQLVGEDVSGTSAAISSRIAAELNGLDVLAQGIEDNEGNSTRFFVVRRQSSDAVTGSTVAGNQETATAEDHQREKTAEFKTLVSFTVDHGEPGALADCLEIFKKYGLNLTSINTRPSGEAAWHYIFFVEFMGRKMAGGQGGAVNEALQELDRVAKSWRWLGSWENALLKPS